VHRVVVVGLGPAGADLLTEATTSAIERVPHRFVRTMRHPAASAVAGATSFDAIYDTSVCFDEVYERIVDALVDGAVAHGEVLYAVPGSPLIAERTVEMLRADERVDVQVVPALSFLDLAWAQLGVDPVASGVRIVDGRRFSVEAAGERGPLLVVQCDTLAVLSDIKLTLEAEHAPAVTVLHHLGLPDCSTRTVDWADLDRSVEPDHLTSLWVPVLAVPIGAELIRFAELVRTLRERCPWDREQTHQSLTRHLLEETYEVLEAIEGLPESIAHLEEELGDLLFQVVFHATLATERGEFTLADVARGIHDKLVHRHPHVFGDVQADTPDTVMRNWEQIKRDEKGRRSLMDGIPGDLPSLLYAHKVQRKAASVGFDWESPGGVYPKIAEELREVEADPGDEELGDLLFAAVNLARHLKVDPEAALRGATAKFRDRFRAMEARAEERGVELTTLGLTELDALWDEVKVAARK
jgi:tetrapyrrole methylase family protein/MazG family protein